jgi:hypothetical protein
MQEFIQSISSTFIATIKDVVPIVLLIVFFQALVIKRNIPNIKRVSIGIIFVILGLTLFLLGLEQALFPIGEMMAKQLSNMEFIQYTYSGDTSDWQAYYWVYIFAGLIGFATTIAEPALKAVAMKANEVSGGILNELTLRVVVAVGAAIALMLGTHRIVVGNSLITYLMVCYVIVIIQTIFANKEFVALAYDSGGVTTSTVTVPIVAALGLGLASVVPGRNPALDGFGLIALVCMFPIITVMGYLQIIEVIRYISKYKSKHKHEI